MYINKIFYEIISENNNDRCLQTNRAKEYIADLYALYQKSIEINLETPLYSYEKMCAPLLQNQTIGTIFCQAKYLFLPTWGYLYDEKYTVPELHLKNVLSCSGNVIDIRDAGILCVYYALHLMLTLQSNNSVCCSIENQFYYADKNIHMPEVNYVGFLSCSTIIETTSLFKILSCNIIGFNRPDNILNFIDQVLQRNKITDNHYIIYFKNNIALSCQNHSVCFTFFSNSSGFIYSCLKDIAQKKDYLKFHYIFLIECDTHTKKCGVLLCKTIQN